MIQKMEISFGIEFIIRIIYSSLMFYCISKCIRWLISYVKLVIALHKIHSTLTMLPFIGNAHQVMFDFMRSL